MWTRRLPKSLSCFMLGVALLLVAGSPPPAAAAPTFWDVPETHWAYTWIERLASFGVVFGYDDGSYKPDNYVTRAEMAVYVGRALHHDEESAGFAFVTAPDSSEPNSLVVGAQASSEATEYRLYKSSNAADWTLATEATGLGEDLGFALWRLVVPAETPVIYLRPVAVVHGVERPLATHPLTARPGPTWPGIVVEAPTGTDVSLSPVLQWTAVPGAVAYMVAVVGHTPDHQDVYRAFVDSRRVSLAYGELTGPGVLGGDIIHQVSYLDPFTNYDVLVRAVDAGGWTFATSGNQPFTTGPR